MFGHGQIKIGSDLRPNVIRAHDRRQNILDALGIGQLEILQIFELTGVQARCRIAAGTGQHLAVLVDDGNVTGRHFRHAAGNKMHYACHLGLVQGAAGIQTH